MTFTLSALSPERRFALWAITLIVASVLSSFALACAIPLAGFATVAALTSKRRAALLLTGAVWLANQSVGFLFQHYPTDASTLAWGAGLGVIALLSCETAGLLARRFDGIAGGVASFLAAFVVYEGLILAATAATGPGVEHVTAPVVSWIFFVNLCAFVGLMTAKAAGGVLADRKAPAAFAPRAA
ncbi:hypothetical protein V3H18_11345 [Methylocystis sp. 9N]|uniref:Uncharacterized protein n=1 Tax=Methylocystis borbori TaxID=3118750 RepID=A0ABU7XIC8_9HYPH